MRRALAIVFALASIAAADPPPPVAAPPVAAPEVVPSRYAITLAPDLAHHGFSGRETIDVTIAAPTRIITLDAKGLAIVDARVEAGGETLAAAVRVDDTREKLVLTLPRAASGQARVVLGWRAPLSRDLDGFYEIETPGDGHAHRWAFTHFEPTSARRAFPAFDTPRYKARFVLTIVTDAGDEAVSNTPVDERAPLDATHVMTRFVETEPLPTYLVAVAVGHFARLSARVGRTDVAVVAPAADVALGRFALDTAVALLPRMEAYFARPYPFAKLDLVAVPAFAPGGMENAATIFLRDDRILVDPASASPAATHAVARLVAHELAHQWLGDLATPRAWNDLWLNEATATYVAHELVTAWRPSWRPWDELQAALGAALADDELPTTHAVRPAAVADDDAPLAFDSMVYEKGAALLRLTAAWLGPTVVRDALRQYVAGAAFAGADAEDFWRALDGAAGRAVSPVVRAWVGTAGHPMVSVDGACEGATMVLHVQQTAAGAAASGAASGGAASGAWPLLLSLRTAGGARVVLVDGGVVRLDGDGGCPAWVDANGGRLGFYRVSYSSRLARALAAEAPSLEPAERVGLLSDAWFDVQRGAAPIGDYLGLVARLRGERAPAVLAELGARLEFVGRELVPAAGRSAFARFVEELLVPAFNALGWSARDGDDDGVR
ncbi:MAG TPA: M1 family metallopeptidase, partial [Polyangia bacterium]